METEQPDGSSSPAAYINYRLEPYDGQPVLYLYEVMVRGVVCVDGTLCGRG